MSKIGIYAGASIFSPVGSPTETQENDKWQWLEAPTAPGCLEWVERQREYAAEQLDNLPMVEEVKARLHELESDPSIFDSGNFTVQHESVRGQSGAKMRYVTLSSKDIEGPLEVIVWISDHFNALGVKRDLSVDDVLQGDISLVPWLERGGGVAVPCIDQTESRHGWPNQDEMRQSWQKRTDDIFAMTEDLIVIGFAEEGKIGVLGSADGGLLSAVVATRQPDLFAAIVSHSPLTDMLRCHKMDERGDQIPRYGDPNDPQALTALRAYSPYHNVEEGFEYPPWLITASRNDQSIGSGHARKMVARLQEFGASEAYLLEDADGGYEGCVLYKNVELMSLSIAFFMYHLS